MSLQDLVFSLGLKSDKFDAAMKGAQKQMRDFGATRLDTIRGELAALIKDGKILDQQKYKALSGELKSLTSDMRNLERGAKSAAGAVKVSFGFDSAVKMAATLSGFNLLSGAMGGITSTAAGWIGKSISLNSSLEDTTVLFTNLAGSADKAKDIIAALRKEADVSPFETNEVIGAGVSLFPNADKDRAKLMDLVQLAEKLTVLNKDKSQGGGLEGAALAIKNALAGDFQSLKDRFNIGPDEIKKLKDAGLDGTGIINAVLASRNITQKTVDDLGKTFSGRLSTVASFVDTTFQKFGSGFFDRISESLGKLGDWTQGEGQTFLGNMEKLGSELAVKAKPFFDWAESVGKNFDVNRIGSSVMGIAKEVGSLLYDELLLAARSMGQIFRESLPEVLGGGKSGAQKDLDSAWAQFGGMSGADQTKQLHGLESRYKQGVQLAAEYWEKVPEYAAQVRAENEKIVGQITALKQVMSGQKLADVGGESFSDIAARHASNMASMARAMGAGGGNAAPTGTASTAYNILTGQAYTSGQMKPGESLEAYSKRIQREGFGGGAVAPAASTAAAGGVSTAGATQTKEQRDAMQQQLAMAQFAENNNAAAQGRKANDVGRLMKAAGGMVPTSPVKSYTPAANQPGGYDPGAQGRLMQGIFPTAKTAAVAPWVPPNSQSWWQTQIQRDKDAKYRENPMSDPDRAARDAIAESQRNNAAYADSQLAQQAAGVPYIPAKGARRPRSAAEQANFNARATGTLNLRVTSLDGSLSAVEAMVGSPA